MSFDPHLRRFDPRWLFPAIEMNAGIVRGAGRVSLLFGR